MCDSFINELLVRLNGKISNDSLSIVKQELAVVCGNYDITHRQASIVPYTGLPQEYKVYMVTLKIEGRSDGTLEQYRIRLEDMLEHVRKPIRQITTNDLRLYLYDLQKRRNLCDRTLNGARAILSAFFSWCADEGYCERNIVHGIKPIKYEKGKNKSLSDTQLETLRNTCNTLREKAIIEVMYSTGCRVSELAHCKLSDVDMNTREVKIFGKGKKYRTTYLNAKSFVALKNYLDSRDDDVDSLFVSSRKPHNAITKDAFEKILKKLGKTANIEKVHPHKMRHTMATIALENGMPIPLLSKYLGHTKLDTTMIYAEVSQAEVSHAHKKYVI